MKTLTETTTGTISNQMILDHCGDYAGKFQDEAYDLLSKVCDLPAFDANQWADIMYDRQGNVYAIWAEDALTCCNAEAKYISLDKDDCEKAFEEMNEKRANAGIESTYDIHFNDSKDSNSKGFKMSLEEAKAYINANNGTNNSYFADYKGGTVSVICNETGETAYETEVK
jgi:hypothetical protein